MHKETREQTEVTNVQEPAALDQRKRSAQRRRLRFVVMTLGVMGIIGYLIYSGINDTMAYYLTVSELVEHTGGNSSQEKIRVSGTVHEGSVSWNPAERTLRFAIQDEQATLPVVYRGIVPDAFKQGQKVIVEGAYVDGVFTASQLLTTCPSKYE